MLLYGGHERGVGEVHAVDLGERLCHLLPELALIVALVPLGAVYRHIQAGDEELLVRYELAVVEVLLHAVHRRAALLAEQRGDEVVPALEGPLKYALGVGAGAVRHVVRRHVRAHAAGRAQPHAEAAGHVEQHLRNVRAVVGERETPLGAGCLDHFVVGRAQELLELNHVLQVSQELSPLFNQNVVKPNYPLIAKKPAEPEILPKLAGMRIY